MFDQNEDIPSDFPKDIRVIRYFSKEFLYEISTAKYIVCNQRIPKFFYMKRRKEQIYLQTWHSSLRLKAIEGDAESDLGINYIENAKYDSKQISYVLSGCEFSSQIFKNSFWYNGEVLNTGTPRIDYLLEQSKNVDVLYQKTGLDKKCKYVLYAPTFRKGDNMSAYDVDMIRLVEVLNNRFGGEWKVLYRLHPNMANRVNLDNLPNCCINMTFYQDMQELLVLSNILITDYSSSMFDYAYLKKLCILYVSDLEQYKSSERSLYFDIEKLPFLISKDNDSLENQIMSFDENIYANRIENFIKQIGSYENGDACEQIYNKVFKEK
jgi:CDP-glycerol glycerophosphotransferase